MTENYAKKELNENIDKTLVRVAKNSEDLESTCGDLYNVIRWAKQGLLVRKSENQLAEESQTNEDGIFDYYSP